jgi:transposase InsO family protein
MVLRVLEQRWSLAAAAEAAGVSKRTCSKWVGRYRVEGEAGCWTVPRRRARSRIARPRIRGDDRVAATVADDRRGEGVVSGDGALDGIRGVVRVGLGKLSRLDPPEPPNRYERRHAGELVHVDVKKLGRVPAGRAGHGVHGRRQLQRSPRRDGKKTVGWEFVHVCVDDATRLASVEVLADEKATTAVGFLERAIAFSGRHGVSVERVMSDNGACYRSRVHALACRALGVRHLRTRPYRPRTNGKAERFIRTLIAGCAS